MWIKAEKPVEKTGQVTSQAQKKKHLGRDLLMMGRPGRLTKKDTDPSLNSVL
jgi:hypothetical protein